jgi:hypothetical protein
MSHHEDNKVGRRRTLQLIGVGGLSAAGLLVLDGCSKGEEGGGGGGGQAAAGEGCNTPLDQQSQTLRGQLQYKEVSEKENQNCANCAQYIEDAPYGDCGGCKLFSGPVQPKGHCLSWAPKQEGAAAG